MDLAVPAESTQVEFYADVGQTDGDRMGVVVVTGLDRPDQLDHAVAGDMTVLELIAAGSDGNIETRKVGLVIDWDPVVADVVQVNDTFSVSRDTERRQLRATRRTWACH